MQRKLAFVHALAKHLLNVFNDDAQLFIGVQPLGRSWRVQVSYEGFLLQKEAADLPSALELMLQHLAKAVSQRLEDGSRLLDQIGVKS